MTKADRKTEAKSWLCKRHPVIEMEGEAARVCSSSSEARSATVEFGVRRLRLDRFEVAALREGDIVEVLFPGDVRSDYWMVSGYESFSGTPLVCHLLEHGHLREVERGAAVWMHAAG